MGKQILPTNATETAEPIKAEILRALETRGILCSLPIENLRINPANPRADATDNPDATDASGYYTDVDDIRANIVTRGFQRSQPLTVHADQEVPSRPSAKVLATITGTVLRGNRRLSAIATMNDEERKTAFPDGTVPVLLFHGLNATEQTILASDHADSFDRKGLDGWERFKAVRSFVRTGYLSQESIAELLGKLTRDGKPDRNWAQKMVSLAKLPADVQTAFRPVLTGDTKTQNLRSADILKLYSEWNQSDSDTFADTFAQFVAGSHPNQAIAKPGKEPAKKPAADTFDYAELRGRREAFDSPTLRKVLADTAKADAFPVALDNAFKRLECDAQCFADLESAVGAKEWSKLTKVLTAYRKQS